MIEIAIVSMPGAVERRKGIAAHLESCPFPWYFVDAAPGAGIIPYSGRDALRVYGRELNAAEIGVFESHVKAVQNFLDNSSSEFVMICEDDIRIDFDFPFDRLLSAMKSADVRFVRLFGRRLPPVRHIQWWRNRWLIRFLWEPFGTQCYILSRAGAAQLLTHVARVVRPIDDQIDRFWENGLPAYSIFPFPVMELQSASSVVRRPVRQSRFRKGIVLAKRSFDRARSFAYGYRLTNKDRAFARALLQPDAERDADR